jgi:hypothetical protein
LEVRRRLLGPESRIEIDEEIMKGRKTCKMKDRNVERMIKWLLVTEIGCIAESVAGSIRKVRIWCSVIEDGVTVIWENDVDGFYGVFC